MSEKNGEIVKEIYNAVMRGESEDKVIKEALDTKDRDHEALIGVLVGALKKMENPIECPSLTHCACADRYENLAQTALKQFGGGR